MVNTTEMSREAFLQAVNFAHNTSYKSGITSTPFEALCGYKPKIPMSNFEAIAAPNTFATERMANLRKAIQWAKEDVEHIFFIWACPGLFVGLFIAELYTTWITTDS